MQPEINKEFFEKLALATKYELLPKGISEVEFTVDMRTGQADVLEYWETSDRLAHQRVEVKIPVKYLKEFVFYAASKLYSLRLKQSANSLNPTSKG